MLTRCCKHALPGIGVRGKGEVMVRVPPFRSWMAGLRLISLLKPALFSSPANSEPGNLQSVLQTDPPSYFRGLLNRSVTVR